MDVGKRCTKCLEVKHLRGFVRARGRPDGLQPWCKMCTAASHKAAKDRNVAKWSEIDPYTGLPYEEKT